jgi:hypothetical protein
MTGSASDFHKFHVAIARKGTAANGYQVRGHTSSSSCRLCFVQPRFLTAVICASHFSKLLSPASVELLMRNSLPGGVTVGEIAAPRAEAIVPAAGYGLGGYSTVATPGSPNLQSAGSYGWDGAAGTKAAWDLTTGIGFLFCQETPPTRIRCCHTHTTHQPLLTHECVLADTQLEFRAAPECEDFVGAITALIYGAIKQLRVRPALPAGAGRSRRGRL